MEESLVEAILQPCPEIQTSAQALAAEPEKEDATDDEDEGDE